MLFISFDLMFMFWRTQKLTHFGILLKISSSNFEETHLGFLGSFDVLFTVLQANYFEKISLILIFP